MADSPRARLTTPPAPGSSERKISDTASTASKGIAGAEVLLEPPGRRSPIGAPLRKAGKLLGPIGTGLDVVDGFAGYRADVAGGASPMDAAVENSGRIGSGWAAAGVGGFFGGPIGALAGGLLGDYAWKKRGPATIEEFRRLAREAAVYNTPRYWLNRRGPPSALR